MLPPASGIAFAELFRANCVPNKLKPSKGGVVSAESSCHRLIYLTEELVSPRFKKKPTYSGAVLLEISAYGVGDSNTKRLRFLYMLLA